MSQFPQFSKPYRSIVDKLRARAGSRALWNTEIKDGISGGVNGLTPWIRVISAVKSQSGGTEKGLILQSNYPEDGFNIRYGGTKNQPSGVVGFTLDLKPVRIGNGRKLRPSPIITNLNIDEADIGRKKTTFDIICYSLEHMEEVAKYFLNPGFTVLVEWGWNTQQARKAWCGYEKSKENKAKGAVSIDDIAKYNNFKHIKDKRILSGYDYDATLGFITDGGLEFGDNETYKISVTLSSIGEVAEYMQNHISTKQPGDKSSFSVNTAPDDEKVIEPEGESHIEVYQNYMINDLPTVKGSTLKEIDAGTDKPFPLQNKGCHYPIEIDNGYHDISSLVNFNAKMVERINNYGAIVPNEDATGHNKRKSGSNPGGSSLPDGVTIIDTERFIRFELAVDILNSDVYDLDGKTDSQSSLTINIKDSFISAFPNMFSTDSSKLFIPNPKAPDFSIDELFFAKEDEAVEVKNIIEFYESGDNVGEVKSTMNSCPEPDGSISYTSTRKLNGDNTPHAFPSQYNLKSKEVAEYKDFYQYNDDAVSVECDKGYWGWLKNLYINYDFFLDTMTKPNLYTKDILYELLNGMSNACDSQWKFQIVETPALTGDGQTELRVIDEYFTGFVNLPEIDNKFQLRGTASPFITANFKTDVPKATQNNIIQKRLSNDDELKTGNMGGFNDSLLRNVFGVGLDDEVLRKISPTQKSVEKKNEEVKEKSEPKEIFKKNLEFFGKKGTVVLRKPFTGGGSETFEGGDLRYNFLTKDDIAIASWNDSDLLRQCRVNAYAKKVIDKNNENLNIPYGLAEVSFQVHGISGFKRGDYLEYVGLPKNFTVDSIFQVHEISHEISSGGWFTNIVTKMRPYKKNKR